MVPPITGSFEVEIKTKEQGENLVENLNDQERKLLLDALNKKMGGKQETTEKKENTFYEHLLNKPNMTAKDKANMEKSIKFLVDNNMYTSENLKKLEAINYESNYIEIAGLKFSREKFVPEVKFNDKPNSYGVFKSNEKGIYKTIHNGKPEYFLTVDQYIQQTKKQGKTAIKDGHLRQALKALPGNFQDNDWYVGGNILGNILNLSMPGYVFPDGKLCNESIYGGLSSASPVSKPSTRVFEFIKDEGRLNSNYNGGSARQCLCLIK